MTGEPGSNRAGWRGDDYAAEAGHHRSFDDWFLNRLRPERDDVIVDLGCGSGEFTARLAELVPDGRVIGIEPDPSMLEAASHHQNPRLEFIQASAEDFDSAVEVNSVDKVISRAMLHWLPLDSYLGVFETVLRVLRPGGWYHSESAGTGNVPELVSAVNDLADRFGVDRPDPFPDPGTVFDLLEEAGFDIPQEGVRAVAQRRRFSRNHALGLLRTQGVVAVIRQADRGLKDAIEAAVVEQIEQLRRYDDSFDQTFVRLEILARRP